MKKIVMVLVLGGLIGCMFSCANNKGINNRNNNQIGGQTNSLANTVIINSGTGQPVSVKPIDVRPVEVRPGGTLKIEANKIQTDVNIASVGVEASVKPVSISADIKPIRFELGQTALNATIELKMPALPSGLFQNQIIITSAPVRVDVNGLDCAKCGCKSNEQTNPPLLRPTGPSWWLPFLCILIGGGAGRLAVRMLGLPKQEEETFEKLIKEMEVLLSVESIKGFPQPLKELLKGHLDDLKIQDPQRRQNTMNKLQEFVREHFRNPRRTMPFEYENALIRLNSAFNALYPSLVSKNAVEQDLKDAFAGVFAAALVPVFLRLASSSLFVDTTNNDVFSIASFFGFCLLAGVLGSEFIITMLKIFRWVVQSVEHNTEKATLLKKRIVRKQSKGSDKQ